MNTAPLDDWTPDELTRLERTILWIQDAIGTHFPWCDALISGSRLSCSCGMDAMRENRTYILNMRAYGVPTQG